MKPYAHEGAAAQIYGLTAIADLSAKAYSHNRQRVQRHLRQVWQKDTRTPQRAGMDTSLYGGARGNGPELHLGLGKRSERDLHS